MDPVGSSSRLGPPSSPPAATHGTLCCLPSPASTLDTGASPVTARHLITVRMRILWILSVIPQVRKCHTAAGFAPGFPFYKHHSHWQWECKNQCQVQDPDRPQTRSRTQARGIDFCLKMTFSYSETCSSGEVISLTCNNQRENTFK